MKLYTEEQVVRAIELSDDRSTDEVLAGLTPIELPSDEEIKQLNPYPFASSGSNLIWYFGAKDIVNWMRNLIQGGSK
jgi:hypothetical protein